MSDTVTIRNKSSVDREIDGVGVCEPGGTIEVPAELANGVPVVGSPPDPDRADPGSTDFYAGTTGLLAQKDVWEKATTKRTTSTPSGEED